MDTGSELVASVIVFTMELLRSGLDVDIVVGVGDGELVYGGGELVVALGCRPRIASRAALSRDIRVG